MLTLFLLDLCMKQCTFPFHNQIGLKPFMNTLVTLISSKDVDQNVKRKILSLVQVWGMRFKEDEDTLPLFSKVYTELKKREVQFSEEATVKVWEGVPEKQKPESERFDEKVC